MTEFRRLLVLTAIGIFCLPGLKLWSDIIERPGQRSQEGQLMAFEFSFKHVDSENQVVNSDWISQFVVANDSVQFPSSENEDAHHVMEPGFFPVVAAVLLFGLFLGRRQRRLPGTRQLVIQS